MGTEKLVKNIKSRRFNDIVLYLLLAFFALIFLLINSWTTTPLSSANNGADSAFFRLVGQGMTKGYLPYRDFFDMKGPYLFFIEYMGALIAYGRGGIFLIQWLNLFLSMTILCCVFRTYEIHKIWVQILLLIPCAWVAAATFEGGNLTEEFSLVPLLSCMWFCLRYFLKCEKGIHCHNIWTGAWYGVCFGFLAFVRVTNAALICAIVLIICINLIREKEYLNLFHNGLMLIAGVCLALLPMVIFYAANGLTKDMFKAVFVFGIKYSAEKTLWMRVLDLRKNIGVLLCMMMPMVMALVLNWRSWREKALLIVGTVATVLAAASGNGYLHYYTLGIPIIGLGGVMIADAMQKSETKSMVRLVLVLFCATLLLHSPQVIKYAGYGVMNIAFPERFNMEQDVQDMACHIPEEEKDSVFSYNLNPSWYTYADLFPCIKYCGWQNHYLRLMPEIEQEMEECFRQAPPKWLVLPSEIGVMPSFLEEEIAENYETAYINGEYILMNYKS